MDTAPGNCAAIRLASVSPVEKSERWMTFPAPITCVTAIASPSARPRPRHDAAATPGRVDCSTTPRITSQRVAPSAAAPVLQLARDGQEEVAAERRDDRQDHDREDQSRGEHARARRLRRPEQRDEAEHVVQQGLEMLLREGRQHEQPPEAEDHAGNRGEHLDQRARPRPAPAAARSCSGRARSRSRAAPRAAAPSADVTSVP